MPHQNGEGRRRRHGGNARVEVEQLGGALNKLLHLKQSPGQDPVIVAELSGDDTCTVGNITVRAAAPTFAMSRRLIAAGFDPNCALHAFRGNTLALTIRTIAEGASLSIDEGRSSFCRWKPLSRAAVSPPMRRNVRAVR